jgi:energy-coupling factor transporter transmembrane protein EcfT
MQLEIILILLLTLLITFCMLIYYSKIHWIVKIFSFTLVLFLGIACFTFYQQKLGSPIKGYPTDDFLYVHHQITNNKEIILWAFYIDKVDHKLYIFPYDRELAKKLESARIELNDGKRTLFKFFTLEHNDIKTQIWEDFSKEKITIQQ